MDTPIATGAADDRDSDIAWLADGGFVVTWTRDFGNGDNDIRAAVMNANGSFRAGGPVDSGGLLVSNVSGAISSTESSVAAYAGGFVVAWAETPVGGGNFSIHYRRYSANGVPIDASHLLLDGEGSENEDVQVIGLVDGGYAFAYEYNNWGTGTTDITFWIFNANGTSRTVVRAKPMRVMTRKIRLWLF